MMKKMKEVYITEPPKLVVGLHDPLIQLRSWLANDRDDLQIASIVGMAGIGKTTLAKQVYEDPFILDHFRDRVWITVTQKYETEEILNRILAQLNPEINQNDLFLSKEDSWCLLRRSLFEHELCPPELVKSGEKIAENCEGLPLLIIAVGKHLAKNEITLVYWDHIAENGNAVVIDEDNELSKVLLSSYKHLAPDVFSIWEFFLKVMRSVSPSSSICGVLRDFLNYIHPKHLKILLWDV
ncbi:hypothetical protein BUALT_Bualt07G0069000 [Buddleja alternifolia]|uniref:NB-ARC domain-containing protein n=1 Tax=Buddleja alternifolia TaxID=168488 RepID=A0AAV6XGJ7_9LAMI|nr:hypothetical protein BUALT_Bualt07G0069000 [Buddleja alternifolia]